MKEGGSEIQRESNDIVKERGAIPTGSTAVTSAGKLRSKYVIHAVGKFHRDDLIFHKDLFGRMEQVEKMNI